MEVLNPKYTPDHHARQLMNGFHRLWQDDRMCDVTLVAEETKFHAHRIVLAACSEYFHLMFNSDFLEQKQDQVELKGVTSHGLKAVLEFAYTGKADITADNLQDVVEAAAHLQFTDLLNYWVEGITVTTCIPSLKLAQHYSLPDHKHTIVGFLAQNFTEINANNAFMDFTAEAMCDLLGDDRLYCRSELEIFDTVIEWVKYEASRKENAEKLLSKIRYGLIPKSSVSNIKAKIKGLMGSSCADVVSILTDYHKKVHEQPLVNNSLNKLRAHQESLLLIGGGDCRRTGLQEHIMQVKVTPCGVESDFCELSRMTEKYAQYYSSAVVLNNFLYIAGGKSEHFFNSGQTSNNLHRYNPRDNTWVKLKGMKEHRGGFVLVVFDNSLIAAGGKDMEIYPIHSSAERYDVATNTWTDISSMPLGVHQAAGCALDQFVYVSGGDPLAQALEYAILESSTDKLQRYNPQADEWTELCPMKGKRAAHGIVSYQQSLYVVGGRAGEEDGMDFPCLLSMESYDIVRDQWTELKPMLEKQREAPVVCLNSFIYLLGGWQEDDSREALRIVQSYDIVKKKWRIEPVKVPAGLTGTAACSLKLPINLVRPILSEED